jgi:hypothetical protein
VSLRVLQFFLLATAAFLFSAGPLSGALSNGERYRVNFVDVDGNALSTADGHVTIVVLTTPADSEKAHTVGDRVPDYCLRNPSYRMITICHLTRKRTGIGRKIATILVPHRLNEEAKRLQARYDAKKIASNARSDIFAVADFDGTASSQLGGQPEATEFHVFVFGRNGELLQQWNEVPSAEDLAAALKQT